jgi:hypothetical protein
VRLEDLRAHRVTVCMEVVEVVDAMGFGRSSGGLVLGAGLD